MDINQKHYLHYSKLRRQARQLKKKIKLMQLYQNLYKSVKLIQKKIKKYYNQKVSKGLDLKRGDKIYLLIKNFKSK